MTIFAWNCFKSQRLPAKQSLSRGSVSPNEENDSSMEYTHELDVNSSPSTIPTVLKSKSQNIRVMMTNKKDKVCSAQSSTTDTELSKTVSETVSSKQVSTVCEPEVADTETVPTRRRRRALSATAQKLVARIRHCLRSSSTTGNEKNDLMCVKNANASHQSSFGSGKCSLSTAATPKSNNKGKKSVRFSPSTRFERRYAETGGQCVSFAAYVVKEPSYTFCLETEPSFYGSNVKFCSRNGRLSSFNAIRRIPCRSPRKSRSVLRSSSLKAIQSRTKHLDAVESLDSPEVFFETPRDKRNECKKKLRVCTSYSHRMTGGLAHNRDVAVNAPYCSGGVSRAVPLTENVANPSGCFSLSNVSHDTWSSAGQDTSTYSFGPEVEKWLRYYSVLA